MTRYRHVARPGDVAALDDLRLLMVRAHAALDERDRCRMAGRPWPTPTVRLQVVSTTRELSRRLIVRKPSNV